MKIRKENTAAIVKNMRYEKIDTNSRCEYIELMQQRINELEDAPDKEECWKKEDRCNDCPAIFPTKACPDYGIKSTPPEEG